MVSGFLGWNLKSSQVQQRDVHIRPEPVLVLVLILVLLPVPSWISETLGERVPVDLQLRDLKNGRHASG